MTEQARETPTCATCGRTYGVAYDHAKDYGHYPPEQARETPEPLTPVVAFLDKYGLANTSGERHAARKEALALARAALRAATPDNPALDGTDGAHPAWWRGSDYGYAKGRAVTPDPAEPNPRCSHAWETDSDICPECGADWGPYLRGNRATTPDPAEPMSPVFDTFAEGEAWLRAATPDPAEPGLREAAQAVDEAHARWETDPSVVRSGSIPMPTDLFLALHDLRDALRAATPDPAEPGLREAAQAVLDHVQPQTGQAPLVPWALLDDLRAALSDTTEGQS